MVRWRKKIDDNLEKISIVEAMEYPLDEFVENPAKFCKQCHNPKTIIPMCDILKLEKALFVQNVLKTIKEKQLNDFSVKQLIKEMDLVGLSNGDLQRKALCILVCLGYLKKQIKEIKIKDKIKPLYLFSLNESGEKPSCMVAFSKGSVRGYAHLRNNELFYEKKYFNLHKEGEKQ